LRKINDRVNPGLLLVGAALLGLLLTNFPFGESIIWIKEQYIDIAPIGLHIDIAHFVEDFVLAFFFLAVGLELIQEFTVGNLKNPKHATIPIVAAVGGMLFPALIFIGFALTTNDPAMLKGFAIPTATDIAFSVGVLALVAKNINPNVRIFLLTLAVADDIGGIIIIAVGYSTTINIVALGAVVALTIVWFIFMRIDNKPIRYGFCTLIGLIAWYFMYQSGIHPAILGVVLGLLVPCKPNTEKTDFTIAQSKDPATIDSKKALTPDLGSTSRAERFLPVLNPYTDLIVLPLYAFTQLAIPLNFSEFDSKSLTIMLGTAIALLVGKPLGIMLATITITKVLKTTLPNGLRYRDYLGVACLAGTGFTVAFLVTDLSFVGNTAITDIAKLGVLLGSFGAIIVATIVFKIKGEASA
jgi:NhaA family Na+:H+ antiporter